MAMRGAAAAIWVLNLFLNMSLTIVSESPIFFNAVFLGGEGCLIATNNPRCRGDCPRPYLPLIARMTRNNIHKMERRKETACTPAGSPDPSQVPPRST